MSNTARNRKPPTTVATDASHEDAVPIPRAPASTAEAKKELKAAVNEQAERTSNGLSVLDILRVLGGLALLSAGLSYLVSSGESMTWGYNAKWTRLREWKNALVRSSPLPSPSSNPRPKHDLLTHPCAQKPQIHLTDMQLASYNGANPQLPIYLALNGTIYDVSVSPQTYGPGGSYHFFAGRDAARAFLTGCFAEDADPDLRGVERMFMPIDPEEKPDASPEVIEKAKSRRKLSSKEVRERGEKELEQARERMQQGLESWHALFRGDKGKPYRKVGMVKRPRDWERVVPPKKLCAQAEKSRPVRKYE
jgi:predicted heme/steroid binding protein